ncbi:hypothetical protein [Altererythrobacter sp. ZODW24]|nr:hypothetical protein [Altererythrobacter sp. ZODW24]
MSDIRADTPVIGKWTKPELKKLGKMADVAGPSGSGAQGTPLRS